MLLSHALSPTQSNNYCLNHSLFVASARSVSVVSMAATAGDAHAVTLSVPGDAEAHALLSALACAVALLHVS